MNQNNQILLKNLYTEYNQTLKPVLASVEALYESHPLPLFNEIRSFNDHIARCYRDDITEEFITEQLSKASHHLKRVIFDCLKYLNVYYHDNVIQFEKRSKHIDLSSISDGNFWIDYQRLRQESTKMVREAKKIEGLNFDLSFEKFQNSTVLYDNLNELIYDHTAQINRARSKFYVNNVIHIIIFIFSSLLFWHNIQYYSVLLWNNNNRCSQIIAQINEICLSLIWFNSNGQRFWEKQCPAKYEIILYWSEADNSFIAAIPELPGCMADGSTCQEALNNAEIVISEWLQTAKELGRTIPQPKGRFMYAWFGKMCFNGLSFSFAPNGACFWGMELLEAFHP
jgi:predicted RNase H-like HicB family nuclease